MTNSGHYFPPLRFIHKIFDCSGERGGMPGLQAIAVSLHDIRIS
jgi:hypothetical protein